MRKLFVQSAVVFFCCWHIVAIGVYSLPDSIEQHPLLEPTLTDFSNLTRPYALKLSLWQTWPLFAPDPLRRVTELAIEAQLDERWVEVHRIAPDTLPWWKKASTLKLIRRLENRDKKEQLRVVNAQFIRVHCSELGLPENTPIRTKFHYFVIPRHKAPQSVDWWRQWQPEWKSHTHVETTCPSQTS